MKKWFALMGLGLLALSHATLAQEDELLEPEKAFAFSAKVIAPDKVQARWDIAPDYYMYRSKFRFEIDGQGVKPGQPIIPKGKIKKDEFFGTVETYVGSVEIELPLKRSASDATTITLSAYGQGCNDPIGVCYPPLVQKAELKLPFLVASAAAATEPATKKEGGIQSLQSLSSLLAGSAGSDPEQQFLDPDQAFKLDIAPIAGNKLRAQFQIADGYYLYRDKTSFRSGTEGVDTAKYQLPAGKVKDDPYFGKVEVYKHSVIVEIPLDRSNSSLGGMVVKAEYQGCAEGGICYPPINKDFAISLPGADAAQAAPATATVTATPAAPSLDAAKTVDDPDQTWLWILLGAFVAGIGLTFTPCVLPLVPILSSIIAGQGENLTKLRGGMMAIVYVLGTAVTYTAAGVIAGQTGDQLQAYLQNPWAIGVVSLIFVFLALSMFGLYEVQMPSFIQSRLQKKTQGMQSGNWGMVFVLGMISAAIVGACVSPVLISFLGLAIQRGDPVLGGAIMFSMSLGMGVFLVALGFGAGFLLPKAGQWMDKVKYGFGVLLLAVAIYLLGVLPEVPVLLLWGALFIVVGVYLGATQALPEGASGWRYLWKGIGTLALVWGIFAILGGLTGSRDILRPIPVGGFFTGNVSAPSEAHLLKRVANLEELDIELAKAKAAGKPVMLDYYADWCVDCLRMEKSTFQDPRVSQRLKNEFVALQVDVTDPNDSSSKAIKKRYGVFGPPAMLFFSRDGKERRDQRHYGYRDADEFLKILDAVSG